MSNLMIEKLSKIIGEEYLIENYSYHKVTLKEFNNIIKEIQDLINEQV